MGGGFIVGAMLLLKGYLIILTPALLACASQAPFSSLSDFLLIESL